MTRYLVTGRPPDHQVELWTDVTELVSVGDTLDLTLTADNEAILIAAGVLSRLDPQVVASAGTITLPNGQVIVSISGTATITDITAADAGNRVTLIFADAASLTDGSNLKLADNLAAAAEDTITLISDGTNWYEEGRSVAV